MKTSGVCPSAEAAVVDHALLQYPHQALPNGHSPIRAVIFIFPPPKAVLMQSWSSQFACLIADWLMGEREANDCFMSDRHFKVLKMLLADEINLGA